ncbi:MAG: SpoIIE family protein phosphatase, partial [Actinomycetes bacterium]
GPGPAGLGGTVADTEAARELVVPVSETPESLSAARAAIASLVPSWSGDAVYIAQLVTVELLTNAWLHGLPPVTLTLRADAEGLLVDVTDTSAQSPTLASSAVNGDTHDSVGGMVGRGLTVIQTLAASWGVEPTTGSDGVATGKRVWARIRDDATLDAPAAAPPTTAVAAPATPSTAAPIPAPARIAAHERDVVLPRQSAAPVLRTVRLTAPTRLLIEVNARVDDVMRELSLIAAHPGDPIPDEPALSPELARAVHLATHKWVDIRRQIQEQAAAAARQSRPFTDLVVEVPTTAVTLGQQFLDAMDDAEQLARVGRLLVTPETPSQRAFRHWSVQAIVDQLRAELEGRPAPATTPFGEVLSTELDRIAGLEEAWDRLQLLQSVSAGLTVTTNATQAATTAAEKVAAYRGVLSVRIYITETARTGREQLRSVAYLGRSIEGPDDFDEIALDSDLPGAVAARTNTPLHHARVSEVYQTFPDLQGRGYFPTERSLHLVPMTVGERPLGLVAVTFADASLAPPAQIDLVHIVADTLAQTLDRIRASEEAQAAAERVALLADASIALSGSLELQPTVDAVLGVLVPRFADWAVVQILREGSLVTVGLHHYDPERRRWAFSMKDRWPANMDSPSGAPAVVRSAVSQLFPVIDQAQIEATARDDEHLQAIRALGVESALTVALIGRSGVIGALTLLHGDSGRHYREADVALVEDIARRAAFAIETAETFREQSGRLASVMRVADAAQRAILTDPPPRIGRVALAARYVSAAAEARVGGDLYEALELPDRIRLLVGDVRGKGLGAVRTATVVLGAFRAAANDVADLGGALSQIDLRMRPFLGDEDFVTAAMVDLFPDGRLLVGSAGHPPPFLAAAGASLTTVRLEPSAPLGLGGVSEVVSHQLAPGDRVLLYTDGLLEARDSHRTFVDVAAVLAPVAEAAPPEAVDPLGSALDAVLDRLQRATGARLGDDLALLAAEYLG